MSTPHPSEPAKLVVGCFLADQALMEPVAQDLADAFGAVDGVSPWFAFDFTTYYAAEMGAPLFRRFLTFRPLIRQRKLSWIKCETNRIEKRYAEAGRRRVNIDPGYLLLSRFVLATGKNYTHRIYIGRGIYADLTLVYGKGGYETLPWTYPDYADAGIRNYLLAVRKKYVLELKEARPLPGAGVP